MTRLFSGPAPLVLAAALAFAAASAQSQTGPRLASAPLQFQIAAQPLATALRDWERQAGISVRAPQALLDGKSAPAVSGSLTPQQALEALLAGSGLSAAPGEGGVVISAAPGASAAATMPAVTVKAAAPQAASEGSGSYTIESTSAATGLDLSLRDTPQSVSVVTRERIDDQAMTTVADALRNTIGVSLKPVDRGRNNLSARGFEINNFQFDGIPMATGNIGIEAANTAIYDRVEIVRGATGLTSGAGDPSAAVNLVRKHADSRTLTGTFSLELGSWQQRSGTLDLTAPLNADASVRARIVASASRQNAFIDLENTRNTVLYGIVDADLGPDTHLSIGASDQRDRRNGVLWAGLPYWYSDGTRTDWDRSKTTATSWNQWDTTEQTAFITLSHQFSNRWKIRGDASYRYQDEDSKLLWMWGDPDRVTGEGMQAYPYHYTTRPRQLQFGAMATGPFTLFGREHELNVGFTHSTLKNGWGNRDGVDGILPVGNFNAWDGSYPEPAMTDAYVASQGKTTQSAVYAAARLQLSDRLKLIAGGRVSHWRRDEDVAVWTPQAYSFEHRHVFTPYAGLVYDLGDQLSAYASYADMFNPQTNRDRNGAYLDPVKGKNYEVGLKGDFLNGKLNATAAFFRIEQSNFAVADVGYFVPGTLEPAFKTAQGVTSQGYELEVSGEIAPGWELTAGWTQFRARDANDLDVAVDHPRRQLKLFTKYALQGEWRGLSIGGGLTWEGDRPATAVNPATGETESVGQPAYALAEIMAKYQFGPRWSLQLNVFNLFDKTYRSGSYWWGAPLTYGEPRRVLLTMDYEF